MKTLIFIIVLIGIFRCKGLLPTGGGHGSKKSSKKGTKKAFFVADLSRGKKHTNYTHG